MTGDGTEVTSNLIVEENGMKLLIKQRVFSWTDTYDVYDEAGNPKYFVKAEFFTLGHQIHVYDMNHNEIGAVKERGFICFRFLILKLAEEILEQYRRNLHSLSQSMTLITTAGDVREIFSHGIMMYIPVAAWRCIFQKKCCIGEIHM